MAVSNSLITNPSSMTALRTLNGIQRAMDLTQNRVSTGLKVNGALDDASNFSIAQGLRSEVRAIGAVIAGLQNAKGVGRVALAGMEIITDMFADMKQKLVELSNEGMNTAQRNILSDDYEKLLSQAADIITNSSFNGVNLLRDGASHLNTLSNLSGGTLTLRAADPLFTNGFETIITNALAEAAVIRTGNAALSGPEQAREELQINLGDGKNDFDDLSDQAMRYMGLLAADVRALDNQVEFLTSLSDTMTEGLGNIVDADMAREAAKLTSLQVQQQLSVQTLGIANQRPQSVLGLFS